MAPLPTAPNPAAWPQRPNHQVWAADLNNQLSSAVRYLAQPPTFLGQQQASAQSIATGSPAQDVVLDTIVVDNYNSFNDTTGKSYSIPSGCGGIYLAVGGVPFNSGNSTSDFQALLDINNGATLENGAKYTSQTSATVTPMICDLLSLTGGNRVALSAFQTTGGAVSLVNTSQRMPYLFVQWVANTSGTAGLTPPNPRTWSLNDLCTSTGAGGNFNTEIFNAVSFLAYRPYMKAVQGSGQSVPSGVNTVLTGLSAAGFDNYGSFGSDTWTCKAPGAYLVAAQAAFTAAAAGSYNVQLKATIGSAVTNYALAATLGAAANTNVCGLRVIRFSDGDTVQLQADQNTGGALTTVAADTRLMTLWVSK